jgi:hypothetical protein
VCALRPGNISFIFERHSSCGRIRGHSCGNINRTGLVLGLVFSHANRGIPSRERRS